MMAGLSPDRYIQIAREPSILESVEQSAHKPSAIRINEDDTISIGLRQSSTYKPSLSIRKTQSKSRTLRENSAQSKKKKQLDLEPFHKPVALQKEKMYDDAEYENDVEIMRIQLARRREKDIKKRGFNNGRPPRPS